MHSWLGALQVQHRPRQLEIAVPEAQCGLDSVGVIVDQPGRVALGAAVAVGVILAKGFMLYTRQPR